MAAEPFTSQDHYVPRPDVPGHRFKRVGGYRGSSYGVTITCSCGADLGWVVLSNATGTENRHRIEVQP